MMSCTAVALPVDVGAKLTKPLLARLKSSFFTFGASTIDCVFVTLCTVVMLPRCTPISL